VVRRLRGYIGLWLGPVLFTLVADQRLGAGMAAASALSAVFTLVIVVLIAVAVGVDPLIPVLVATAAAGYGLVLPVSTPPNAIMYGTGMVPLTPCCAAGRVRHRRCRGAGDRCAGLRATDRHLSRRVSRARTPMRAWHFYR
jgi:hypothetical protein